MARKKYYCDFCKCSFPDSVVNRQKHNNGALHQANRKFHYDWFKDPSEFIQEQLSKSPCRRYFSEGYCEYQLDCKYSHVGWDPARNCPIYPSELTEWLEERAKIDASNTQGVKSQSRTKRTKPMYKLPAGWKVRDLPLSLRPPSSEDEYRWSNVGYWGW
ncbi:hypothetical protein VTP01DRAFT_5384 [Rhizomucor pusillus]|uniref:uncharacterized protein n=1 Tax=Rhizomucor pusillus TaxID=4840 RepID=UPI0037429DFE